MTARLPTILLLTAAALPAQELPTPFRKPDILIELSPELMREFRTMRTLVENPPPGTKVELDAEGREVSTDPEWENARRRTLSALPTMAGTVGYVFHQSANPEDRAVAGYALFFLEDLPRSVEYTTLFAGEPVYDIRQRGLARAIKFLDVQLRKEENGQPVFQLDVEPFLAMLKSEVVRDDTLSLWFLARLAEIRPSLRPTLLLGAKAELQRVFAENDRERMPYANDLLMRLDPQADDRAVVREDATAKERLAWLAAVDYTLFPPIRRLGDGLYELHASKDRDEIVTLGREALRTDALGVTVHGKLGGGQLYRGYRLARVPAPFDKLGLPRDAIVTSINGQPVATAAELLALIEQVLRSTDALLVEFVADGRRKAIEYRIRS